MTGPVQEAPSSGFLLNCAGTILDLRDGPKIMGILNTTPDSFHDGGSFLKEENHPDFSRALDHALSMIEAGASIIDIGGESTRPGAEKVSPEEEIRRTLPLIRLLREKTDTIISIDTYKAEVAEKALEAGANIVNDISGFTFDPALPEVCSRYRAGVILMHTPATPQNMQWSTMTGSGNEDVVSRVARFLDASITLAAKHSIQDIIIDPGFGFGKSVAENFLLLARLGELGKLGRPVLAGVSRKSFLGHAITPPGEQTRPPSERLYPTIAAETIALLNGASIIRAHDVEAAVQCTAVVRAMSKNG